MVPIPDAKLATWEEWERAYESAAERHYSLSPHWGRTLCAAQQGSFRAFRFDFPCQAVVLPCLIVRKMRGVLHGLQSMPVNLYGGFLSAHPLGADLIRAVAESLAREWLLHTLYVSGPPGGDIAGWQEYKVGSYTTQILDLSGGYGDVWIHKVDGKQRNHVRKAQLLGVAVRKDSSPEGAASFFELYIMTCRRQGVEAMFSQAFFERFVTTGGSAVELWLASWEGRDIAGIIVTNNGRDRAEYRFSASDTSYKRYNANRLMLSMAIDEACQRGYRTFDFGSSKQIASLEQFKASFGAVRMPVLIYRLPGRLPSAKRQVLSVLRGTQAVSEA